MERRPGPSRTRLRKRRRARPLTGAHQTLAYVYLVRKQFDQAIAEAEEAVRQSNDADACVTLGNLELHRSVLRLLAIERRFA